MVGMWCLTDGLSMRITMYELYCRSGNFSDEIFIYLVIGTIAMLLARVS